MAGGGKKKTLEETYQKKTQLEHIILRPDTYIGSCEVQTERIWVWDSANLEMVLRDVTYVPGLYKIFDEILVNAADNRQRCRKQNKVKVEINPESGFIKVWNNGEGIPVQIHKEHNIYIPDMIFGHLLTGSNYDDNEKKTTGGRNGYGAKLANIFSRKFTLETAHRESGKIFRKTWRDNMSRSEEPIVNRIPSDQEDFTAITFWPDLQKFKLSHIDSDH
eukprot:gene16182-16465_t